MAILKCHREMRISALEWRFRSSTHSFIFHALAQDRCAISTCESWPLIVLFNFRSQFELTINGNTLIYSSISSVAKNSHKYQNQNCFVLARLCWFFLGLVFTLQPFWTFGWKCVCVLRMHCMCNNVRFLCQVCWMKKKINIISNYYHSALVDFGEHAA